jgi:hypothetical protein
MTKSIGVMAKNPCLSLRRSVEWGVQVAGTRFGGNERSREGQARRSTVHFKAPLFLGVPEPQPVGPVNHG